MRLLLLALAVTLTAGQSNRPVAQFDRGKTYVYKYDVIMLTSKAEGLASAGIKISCDVLLSAPRIGEVIMKLHNVSIYDTNEYHMDKFIKADQLSADLASDFEKSIKFEFSNGTIGNISIPANTSLFVMNIQKSIVNIFGVNIKQSQTMYTLQEVGSQGTCKTTYIVQDLKTMLKVSKSKNLKDCRERVMKTTGLSYADSCEECVATKESIKGSDSYKYLLKRINGNYLITNVSSLEQTELNLFADQKGGALMKARQFLNLKEIRDGAIFPTPGLHFSVSQKYTFSKEGEYFPFMFGDVSHAEAQVNELLERLVNKNNESVSVTAPVDFIKLVKLLRAAPSRVMYSVWNGCTHLSKYRQMLREAIPFVGDLNSISFIKAKFIAGELTSIQAAQMFLISLQYVDVTGPTMLVAQGLLENPRIIEDELVRKVTALGVGSMTKRWCVGKKGRCLAPTALTLQGMLNRAILDGDSKTISLALKALSNAASPDTLKSILALLPGYGHTCNILEPQVIVDAVMALRRFAKVIPREVQQATINLLINRNIFPELRMIAAIGLFETVPSLTIVTTMASHMRSETNLQVVHFLMTLMDSLSRSPVPDRHKLAQACREGLTILRRAFPRIATRFLSRAFSKDRYSDKYRIGASIFSYAIKNNLSPFPKDLIFRLEAMLGGLRGVPFEMGFRVEALLESLMKVTSENISRKDKIEKIARILSSADPKVLRRLQSEVYFLIGEQTLFYLDLAREIVDFVSHLPARSEVLREAIREIIRGYSGSLIKGMILHDINYILATSCGLPFSINTISSIVSVASLHVKAGTTPPLPEDYKLHQLIKANISVKAKARLSFRGVLISAVGVSTNQIAAQLKSHFSVHGDFPISFEARAEISKGKLSIDLKETGAHEIASVSTETVSSVQTENDREPSTRPLFPVLAVKELPSLTPSSAEDFSPSSESVILTEMPDEVEKLSSIPDMRKKRTVLGKVIGGLLVVETETRSTSSDKNCLSCYLYGSNKAILKIESDEDKVEEISVNIAMGREAEDIMSVINKIKEEDTLEDTNVLMKLKKILTPGLKNQTSSSSSSESSSADVSFTSSSSSQSTSSSESSESSSRESFSLSSSESLVVDMMNFISHEVIAGDSSEVPQTDYSANDPPTMSLTIKIIKKGGRVIAYGAAVYHDDQYSYVQVAIASLSGDRSWAMRIKGFKERGSRVKIEIDWGRRCTQYHFGLIAEKGVVDRKPAGRVIAHWREVPDYLRALAKLVTVVVSRNAHEWGLDYKEAKNPSNTAALISVLDKEKLKFKMITPEWNLTTPDFDLIVSEIVRETYAQLEASYMSSGNRMAHVVSSVNAAKCTLVQDTVVTFNNRVYKSELPHICNQVLAQDCTTQRKFLVLLKKDLIQHQNAINVLVADIDVSIHQRGNAIGVTVNGIEIPISNLPYQHPTGTVHITRKDEGISLFAASHGLNEVFLDLNGLQIKIPDWMRGQTCGMCGHGDGEFLEEYRTPNGRLSSNALSFTQSWVVPGTGCSDVSKCYLASESVKLDRQISLYGQESKCYSVEPVLRCQPGCTPVRTTPVKVGFHCVPVESSVKRTESLSSIFQKSVDVTENTVAHLACRCDAQCA